jgi:hypothetical protein
MLKNRKGIMIAAAAAMLLGLVAIALPFFWRVSAVRGVISSHGKPLAGATVRVKSTDFQTTSDASGRFALTGFDQDFEIVVTAWQNGYYISGESAFPWKTELAISLEPYFTSDNPAYRWITPKVTDRSAPEEALARIGLPAAARISFKGAFLPLAARLPLGCVDCHGEDMYRQYASGAHAQGSSNLRFMTVYNGTDTDGNRSPPTDYGSSRDYGRFPLPPDFSRPYYGPGFKLDFPDQAGNCATCHSPGDAINAPYNTDENNILPDAVQGTHCDFCHKISAVKINPATGVPYENMPGVLSLEFSRPAGGQQLFFGPLDDVNVGPDTHLPLQNESQDCAACHNASFWGTPIYQSYSEWLNSPYPEEGKTCQTCHMPPDGITTNFASDHGGLERDPQQIFTHGFPGAADVNLLQHTASLDISASREEGQIQVEVRVTNENGGHDIPTDHPSRNMLLVVTATDASGRKLNSTGNQLIPDWGGIGTSAGDYAGLPGKGYAKILADPWTEESPVISYWRHTIIKEDTRIAARATDTTLYQFQAPETGRVTIEARLIFRRAFKELADQKKWDVPDIEMNRTTVTVP